MKLYRSKSSMIQQTQKSNPEATPAKFDHCIYIIPHKKDAMNRIAAAAAVTIVSIVSMNSLRQSYRNTGGCTGTQQHSSYTLCTAVCSCSRCRCGVHKQPAGSRQHHKHVIIHRACAKHGQTLKTQIISKLKLNSTPASSDKMIPPLSRRLTYGQEVEQPP